MHLSLFRVYNFGVRVLSRINQNLRKFLFLFLCYAVRMTAYIFKGVCAGKAVTFRNNQRYNCHNSEIARSVHWINRTIWQNWEHAATSETESEVSNERRNNDTRFTSLPLVLLRTFQLNQLEQLIKNQLCAHQVKLKNFYIKCQF